MLKEKVIDTEALHFYFPEDAFFLDEEKSQIKAVYKTQYFLPLKLY